MKTYFIVIQSKEFYTNILNFPKCKKKSLNNLIYNELKLRYNNDNLLYSYQVLKYDKKNISASVFYFPYEIDELARFSSYKIKRIFLLQICVLSYIKKKIKESNFAVIFCYMDILYCFCCRDCLIIDNSLLHCTGDESLCIEFIENYIKKITVYNDCRISAVYGLNLRSIANFSVNQLNYRYVDLGDIDEYKFLKHISNGRR
jgi:hypothetical protein